MNLKRNFPFFASCFAAGAVVLMVELAGARWLAPAFGSGLEVWAALLTVTLLAIAFGAWAGGALADRWPRNLTLALLWLASAASLAIILLSRGFVLEWTAPWGPAWGALASGFFLYFPSLVLLSTAPPLAVRLSTPSPDRLGRTVGYFSAVGTLGSCLGALLTGFLLVPLFPISRLFAGSSVLSAVVSLLFFPGAFRNGVRMMGVLLWAGLLFLLSSGRGFAGFQRNSAAPMVLDTRDSLYGRIQILDNGKDRFLLLDGILQGGQQEPTGVSIAKYTTLMEAIGRSAVPAPKRVLVVGLGAAILPERFQVLGAQTDTVEINPQMVSIARRWFGFDPAPGHLFIEDGRRFLAEAKGPYDLILLDAFSGEAVPGQILTVECFRRCRELLRPDGALLMNYVGCASGPMAVVPEILQSTLQTVFPQVEVFATGTLGERDNLTFAARPQKGAWGPVPKDVPTAEEGGEDFRRFTDFRRELKPTGEMFTDDWHPADWLDRENRMLWRREALDVSDRLGLDRVF